MSGIAGIVYFDGTRVEQDILEGLIDAISHRGPDQKRVFIDNSVGLAHCMLWTTPESLHETLPFVSRDERLIITADARIDNRDELLATLDTYGKRSDEVADSELILSAYEKWGEHSPERFLGDFAFAIWDQQTQTLFCARDHFGLKPFFYYHTPEVFVFASEIKALLTLPFVPRQLNDLQIAVHLALGPIDKAATSYKFIHRLAPAHAIVASAQGLSLRNYWQLDPTKEICLGSDEEYAQAFRDIFTKAVECRLRSAFPVGSFLSGGMDSSSVTCVARDLLRNQNKGPLSTFSALMPDVPSK